MSPRKLAANIRPDQLVLMGTAVGNVLIERRDASSAEQNELLASVGGVFEFIGPTIPCIGYRGRLDHCFVTRYGSLDPRVPSWTGIPKFREVFARFWAERLASWPLNADTELFIGVFGFTGVE